jgi:hypothetical protein
VTGVVLNQVKVRSVCQLHAYREDRVANEGSWRVEEPPAFNPDLSSQGRTGS